MIRVATLTSCQRMASMHTSSPWRLTYSTRPQLQTWRTSDTLCPQVSFSNKPVTTFKRSHSCYFFKRSFNAKLLHNVNTSVRSSTTYSNTNELDEPKTIKNLPNPDTGFQKDCVPSSTTPPSSPLGRLPPLSSPSRLEKPSNEESLTNIENSTQINQSTLPALPIVQETKPPAHIGNISIGKEPILGLQSSNNKEEESSGLSTSNVDEGQITSLESTLTSKPPVPDLQNINNEVRPKSGLENLNSYSKQLAGIDSHDGNVGPMSAIQREYNVDEGPKASLEHLAYNRESTPSFEESIFQNNNNSYDNNGNEKGLMRDLDNQIEPTEYSISINDKDPNVDLSKMENNREAITKHQNLSDGETPVLSNTENFDSDEESIMYLDSFHGKEEQPQNLNNNEELTSDFQEFDAAGKLRWGIPQDDKSLRTRYDLTPDRTVQMQTFDFYDSNASIALEMAMDEAISNYIYRDIYNPSYNSELLSLTELIEVPVEQSHRIRRDFFFGLYKANAYLSQKNVDIFSTLTVKTQATKRAYDLLIELESLGFVSERGVKDLIEKCSKGGDLNMVGDLHKTFSKYASFRDDMFLSKALQSIPSDNAKDLFNFFGVIYKAGIEIPNTVFERGLKKFMEKKMHSELKAILRMVKATGSTVMKDPRLADVVSVFLFSDSKTLHTSVGALRDMDVTDYARVRLILVQMFQATMENKDMFLTVLDLMTAKGIDSNRDTKAWIIQNYGAHGMREGFAHLRDNSYSPKERSFLFNKFIQKVRDPVMFKEAVEEVRFLPYPLQMPAYSSIIRNECCDEESMKVIFNVVKQWNIPNTTEFMLLSILVKQKALENNPKMQQRFLALAEIYLDEVSSGSLYPYRFLLFKLFKNQAFFLCKKIPVDSLLLRNRISGPFNDEFLEKCSTYDTNALLDAFFILYQWNINIWPETCHQFYMNANKASPTLGTEAFLLLWKCNYQPFEVALEQQWKRAVRLHDFEFLELFISKEEAYCLEHPEVLQHFFNLCSEQSSNYSIQRKTLLKQIKEVKEKEEKMNATTEDPATSTGAATWPLLSLKENLQRVSHFEKNNLAFSMELFKFAQKHKIFFPWDFMQSILLSLTGNMAQFLRLGLFLQAPPPMKYYTILFDVCQRKFSNQQLPFIFFKAYAGAKFLSRRILVNNFCWEHALKQQDLLAMAATLTVLNDMGLRCNKKKSLFAQYCTAFYYGNSDPSQSARDLNVRAINDFLTEFENDFINKDVYVYLKGTFLENASSDDENTADVPLQFS